MAVEVAQGRSPVREAPLELLPVRSLVVPEEAVDRAEELGEEGGHAVIGHVLAREHLTEEPALVVRVRPMLDAAAALEDRVLEVGDVSRREDVVDRGLETGVDEDAVVELETAVLQPAGGRRHSDSDDDEIRLDVAAGSRPDDLDLAVAEEALDSVVEQHLDPAVSIQVDEERRERGRPEGLEGSCASVDDRHLDSACPKRGRHLEADEAGADDDRSEEHTSELQSRQYLVCRLLLEK